MTHVYTLHVTCKHADRLAGAGSTIGSARVSRAEADGYTLLFGNIGTHAANVGLYRHLLYNPQADFEPVMLVASVPFVVAAKRMLAGNGFRLKDIGIALDEIRDHFAARAHHERRSLMISGIKIPDSRIAREATELVRQHESELLFNHSVRVFLFGAMKGVRQNLKFDAELLFVAALFHDLGLVDAYHTETRRFEVDGADAARGFLKSHGIPEGHTDLVWEAIALHTTPGIPEYMRPEIALTRAGVLVDVVGIGYDAYTAEQRDQVIDAFPRGDFKNEFIEVQTCSALKKPSTTFGTVNYDFIEHRDPTFHKPNACTRIRNTPWLS